VKGNGAAYDQKPNFRSWRIGATRTEKFLTDGAEIALGAEGVLV